MNAVVATNPVGGQRVNTRGSRGQQTLVFWTANPRGGCHGLRRLALVWRADAVRVELQQSTTNTQTIQRYQWEHPEPQVRERLGAAMTWPWPSSSHSARVPVLALNQSTSA